jgi:hypothetical protein
MFPCRVEALAEGMYVRMSICDVVLAHMCVCVCVCVCVLFVSLSPPLFSRSCKMQICYAPMGRLNTCTVAALPVNADTI